MSLHVLREEIIAYLATWGIGVIIGFGNALLAEKCSVKCVVGQALVTGGLAAGAGAALVFIPDISVLTVCGLAALVASIGKDLVLVFVKRKLKINRDKMWY